MSIDAFHTPNLSHAIIVMIINTGQICAVNVSDRPRMCHLYCLSWKKNVTYYKEKTSSEKIQCIKDNFCFIQLLIMYRHFLDLISLDFGVLIFFESSNITIGRLNSKGAAIKRSHSYCQVYYFAPCH